MSGFVALLRRDGAAADPRSLDPLLPPLHERGPDGSGRHCQGPIALAHTLLRTRETLEETSGPHRFDSQREPTATDHDVWIVADARIDDRRRLAADLGHPEWWRLEDGLLILRAWQLWGEACVEHLLGDFAFALWDGRRRQLFAARDPLGVKPCYWFVGGGAVGVGNTLSSLRRHPAVSNRLNTLAVADFLVDGCNQDLATTTFAELHRLPPGHVLRMTPEDGAPQVSPYETFPDRFEPTSFRDAGERVDAYRAALDAAVEDRLTAPRASIYLSGGMDSTTVTALAARHLDEGRGAGLRAFTLVYERLFDDPEGPVAQRAAEFLGISGSLHPLDDALYFEDRHRHRPPEPYDGSHLPLDRLLLDPVARHGRIAMTGDGADPALYHPSDQLWRLLAKGRVDRALVYVLGHWIRTGRRPPLGLRTLWGRLSGRLPTAPALPSWLAPQLTRQVDLEGRRKALEESRLRRFAGRSRSAAWLGLSDPQWPAYFEAADPGSSGRPIETRYPFFDLRVLAVSLGAPTEWCLDKRLLRDAMAGILPSEVLERTKTPMAGNPGHGFSESPLNLFERLCLESEGVLEYVDRDSFVEVCKDWCRRASPRSLSISPPDPSMLRALELAFWLADLGSDKERRI